MSSLVWFSTSWVVKLVMLVGVCVAMLFEALLVWWRDWRGGQGGRDIPSDVISVKNVLCESSFLCGDGCRLC